jgi:hypothetical protein
MQFGKRWRSTCARGVGGSAMRYGQGNVVHERTWNRGAVEDPPYEFCFLTKYKSAHDGSHPVYGTAFQHPQ